MGSDRAFDALTKRNQSEELYDPQQIETRVKSSTRNDREILYSVRKYGEGYSVQVGEGEELIDTMKELVDYFVEKFPSGELPLGQIDLTGLEEKVGIFISKYVRSC